MERSRGVTQIFRDDNGVDNKVLLQNRRGHSVRINLCGGQVTSWKLTPREELLFISSQGPSTALRGGIPICFPLNTYDGGASLQQHGFARRRLWVIDNYPPPPHPNDTNDTNTFIDLLHTPSPADLRVWPHNFEFRLRVILALDGSLSLISRIRNISPQPFSFFFVHHSYFAVPDISNVRVEGLETLHYLDKLEDGRRFTEQGAVTIESKVDRVYLRSSEEIAVRAHEAFKKRTFLINKSGLPDTVVWNPWREKNAGTAYFAREEYTRMVCVGGAAIENPITLNPAEEWRGKLSLSFKRQS